MAGNPTCFEFDSTGFTLDSTLQSWDQTICPQPPAPPRERTTVGGMGLYQIELPKLPKKPKPYRARRGMENQDRDDIKQIIEILMRAGML